MPDALHKEGDTTRVASIRLDALISDALIVLAAAERCTQSDMMRRLVLEAIVAGRAGQDDQQMLEKAREVLSTQRVCPGQ